MMKKVGWIALFTSFLFVQCKRENVVTVNDNPVILPATSHTYVIPEGEHYCLETNLGAFEMDQLSLEVTFDSSAIYTSVDPVNQWDWNKLIGFSDCGSFHQVNSFRIGWRWTPNYGVELAAYGYENGNRYSQAIDTIELFEKAQILISKDSSLYYLNLNGRESHHLRGCDSETVGYWLYPYFGGDEVAPDTVQILLNFLNTTAPGEL